MFVHCEGTLGAAITNAATFTIFSAHMVTTSPVRTSQLTRPISVYSFYLKPEDHQPSGTCNFSSIDTAQLIFGASKAATVYAVNYNVLRIIGGMGGLAYSN